MKVIRENRDNLKSVVEMMRSKGFTWFSNTLEDDYDTVVKKVVKPTPKTVYIAKVGEEYSVWYR